MAEGQRPAYSAGMAEGQSTLPYSGQGGWCWIDGGVGWSFTSQSPSAGTLVLILGLSSSFGVGGGGH